VELLGDNRRTAPAKAVDRSILEVAQLGRRFGAREVLRDIDISLGPGERLAVTGPNGSGKTTLLRCVSGTLIPSSGQVRICGHEAGSVQARRHLGISLSQERSFYLRLSGRENLRYFARLRYRSEQSAKRTVDVLVEELELGAIAAQRVDRCSTGMVQQLALARALLGQPALLALDEPTRSLDEGAVNRLWAALDRRPQTTVLIATHRDDDAARCGGRLNLGAEIVQ
jgi:ABC-2 type transport system ATP-binding protein